MNAVLGQGAVALGLVASLGGAVVVVVGLTRNRPRLVHLAADWVWLVLAAALGAVLAMERALITRDFTLVYVAEHGSTKTPPLFNVSTLWAALEGSILLWLLVLAGYLVAVRVKFRRRLDDPMVGWALLVMLVVTAFFFALVTGPADPFTTWDPPLGYDGPGPNPLLQNHPLMAFHPPMLYLGYVGFTVPFAFAVAALVTGRMGEGWLVATRRWTLASWAFLSMGILAGAWWSYEVLGWGGYWAWDPVENASLLPWLTATAFIHSVMVQERRGMLRVWNISLLAATFTLTILGTFITRSGVLESVHAFTESAIGSWLLTFFAMVVALTVGLIAWRGDALRTPARIDAPLSREAAFLANNVVFAAFAFVVLLGTVFPLVVEAAGQERVSVGVPYFNRMTMPLGLTLLFLMAVAPVLPWRRARGEVLARRLSVPVWCGALAALVGVLAGARGLAPVAAFALGGMAAGSAGRQLVLAVRRRGWRGLAGRTSGGMIVHLGIIMIGVALAASSSYLRQSELTLDVGEVARFAGHELVYVGPRFESTARTSEAVALVTVDGAGPYAPRLVRFDDAGQTVGTPSVRSTWRNDVHLSLLEAPEREDGAIRLRVTVQPLVVWLWIGGGVVALGSVAAMVPLRGRDRRARDTTGDQDGGRAGDAAGPAGTGEDDRQDGAGAGGDPGRSAEPGPRPVGVGR